MKGVCGSAKEMSPSPGTGGQRPTEVFPVRTETSTESKEKKERKKEK